MGEPRDRRSRARLLRAAALTFLALPVSGSPAVAQGGLPFIEDATTVPRGLFRLRAIAAWTRYDERFTQTGSEPLGGFLTSDSLGVNQVPPLVGIQSLVTSASASPFTLNIGRSRLDATARQEIVPLGLEYGLTDRLSLSVFVPIVRKRVTTLFRIDTTGNPNVGPNPGLTSFGAAQTNNLVQLQFGSAVLQLQDRLATCASDPAAPGCASVVGREAQAQQLINASQGFANTLAALYGSAALPGMAFVPRNTSSADTAIRARVSDFNTQFKDLLGTSTDLLSARPVGAGGPVGVDEFQRYMVEDLGADSLNTQERLGFGDIEVGFRFRALQLASRTSAHPALRLTVASSVRLPTGSRRSTSDIADLRLGEGSVILDSRAILDLRTGRFGVLATGWFAARVHDSDTLATTTQNNSWGELDVAPRWHFSEPFALHAAYSYRHAGSQGSDQLVGGGVSYSTLSSYQNRRTPLPLEMRFTHLEAVTGDAGRPKFFRDQLEVRVYFRLR